MTMTQPMTTQTEQHNGPYTRFDLEDAISNLQSIETDLQTVLERVMDHDVPPTDDELSNALIGLIEMTKFRGSKVNMVFESLIKHRKIL